MPRPDGRPTINEIMQAAQADACVVCGGELEWVDEARGMNDDLWVNSDTCSEPCFRTYAGKTWPKEEDCSGCPCHKDGPHKFGCSIHGARQIKIPVVIR